MKRGISAVTATSPAGTMRTVRGTCLAIAYKVVDASHFTVHEETKGDALVAIIPTDWHLELELNQ